MKLNLIISLNLLLIFISCNGQTNTQAPGSEILSENHAWGETVKTLSDNIMAIYQDSKNKYWFGSWKDGLYMYDGKSVIQFTTKHGLPSNRVEEIKEDNLGNIYINTSEGLCKYNDKSFVKLKETKGSSGDWKLNPDDLWFRNSGKVFRFDGNTLFSLELPQTKIGEDYVQKYPSNPSPYAVYCIYKDSKGNIWFGTATLGVCRYDGKSFDWITEPDLTEIHDGPANGVRSIAEDKNGDFWFNTGYRYNIYNNKASTIGDNEKPAFYERIKSLGSLDGIAGSDLNEYLSILKDKQNNLWIAIYLHGVWKYDGAQIRHYPIRANNKTIPVYCLYLDNMGDLWLGTHENGVFKFNGLSFEKFVP